MLTKQRLTWAGTRATRTREAGTHTTRTLPMRKLRPRGEVTYLRCHVVPAITQGPRQACTTQSTSRDPRCAPQDPSARMRPSQSSGICRPVMAPPPQTALCSARGPSAPSLACAGETAGPPGALCTEQDPRSSTQGRGAPACNENGALDSAMHSCTATAVLKGPRADTRAGRQGPPPSPVGLHTGP